MPVPPVMSTVAMVSNKIEQGMLPLSPVFVFLQQIRDKKRDARCFFPGLFI